MTIEKKHFGDTILIEIPTYENRDIVQNHNPFHNWVHMDGSLSHEAGEMIDWALRVLAQACFVNSRQHGWYEQYMDDQNVLGQRNFGEVIALITSEASEALEEFRDGDDQRVIKYAHKNDDGTTFFSPEFEQHWGDGELGKPEGIAAEFADVLIRVMDYCGAYNVPIADAVIDKHRYNQSRPYRHGGKLA